MCQEGKGGIKKNDNEDFLPFLYWDKIWNQGRPSLSYFGFFANVTESDDLFAMFAKMF